jgi:hypothetical protein
MQRPKRRETSHRYSVPDEATYQSIKPRNHTHYYAN